MMGTNSLATQWWTHTTSLLTINPIYSDNMVSINDINILLSDLQALPLFSPMYFDPLIKWVFGWICVLLLAMVVFFRLGATKSTGFLFVVPVVFRVTLVLIFVIACKSSSIAQKRTIERKSQVDQVLVNLQNSTFAGNNVLLKMSPHGSYIAIEFLFRVNNAQGQPAMVMPSASGMPQAPMNMYQAQPQFGTGFQVLNKPNPSNSANQNAPIF